MEKLHISLILELLGRPPEHLKEALDTLIARLSAEKGVKLISKHCHEPNQVKDANNLYTTFAELELELDTLSNYLGILFAYMPSHIEIIKPEKITLTNTDLNDLGNKLVLRLHEYDAITKNTIAERDYLTQKLQELAPQFFSQSQMLQKPTKTKKRTAKRRN